MVAEAKVVMISPKKGQRISQLEVPVTLLVDLCEETWMPTRIRESRMIRRPRVKALRILKSGSAELKKGLHT